MYFILNYWRQIANEWKDVSKSLYKAFCFTNKGTLKAKDLNKISNKEIYCPFQCSSQWKKKLFELISWPEVIEEYQNLR